MTKWKKAFIVIAAVDLIVILLFVVLYVMATRAPEQVVPRESIQPPTSPIFTVHADKKQLTKLINAEIEKHPTGNLSIYIRTDQTVDLIGNLKLLGIKMPFTMSFSPSVDEKGNVILNEEAVKLGQISLPESEVLKFIRSGAGLPKWVIVDPNKKQIYVDLNGVLIKDRFFLRAKEIDLARNVIEFNVYGKTSKK
ncbi:YpmS family protein [Camelliibacillus cellulosilyticus]|uniref:YpmS family protein n=1 Tax=Camelliibacillus cellulosilyticus TaxID=2174486 RepID=A0ABV9GP75_9BACL